MVLVLHLYNSFDFDSILVKYIINFLIFKLTSILFPSQLLQIAMLSENFRKEIKLMLILKLSDSIKKFNTKFMYSHLPKIKRYGK